MKWFLFTIAFLSSFNLSAQPLETDRLALIDLYNATNGAEWTNNAGWTVPGHAGDNPCGWYGIGCNEGRVTSISLFTNNLTGNIPASIANLSSLENLNLGENKLSGSLPTQLGSIAGLKSLDLYSNQFSGDIPASIGNLSNLTSLLLFSNQLSGSIPASFGNLTKLQALHLSSNQLSGNLPAELGNLSQLSQLYIYSNQLTGPIPPELGNLTLLRELFLSANQLNGSIPAEFGNMVSMETMNLSYNQLSGEIPVQIGNLTNLDQLFLFNNQLTGSIPSSIGNLSGLEYFFVHNNQLSGVIPNLSGIPASSLIYIDNNKFTFDGMESNINYLDSYSSQAKLALNFNNGFLTVNAGGTKANNTYKWYRDNTLIATNSGADFHIVTGDGTYYVEVTNKLVPQLTLFSDSYIVGSNPLENDRLALVALYNSANGSGWFRKDRWNVPGNPGDNPCGWEGISCNEERVTAVKLENNNLIGNVPSQIGNLTKLSQLHLQYNQISGSIPFEVGQLVNLDEFYINNNQLTGSVPDLHTIPLTCWINVSNNKLTFDGLELYNSSYDYYYSQAAIPTTINNGNGLLSVFPGGTMANNTFKWYKDGLLVATIVGNNTYPISSTGTYFAEIRNNKAAGLVLYSENFVQSTPLPVTLVNFSGRNAAEGNVLKWATTTETNNAGFEIQRSNDAKSFEKIGYIDGKGQSAGLVNYDFLDSNPALTSYYRLKQIDYNGAFDYSRIIQIRSEAEALKVYPNPAKGQFTIESTGNGLVEIFSVNGSKITEKPAVSLQTISTANWQTGLYIIKVGSKTEKIMVEN